MGIIFDEEAGFAAEIRKAFPDLHDEKLIQNAAGEMLEADDEAVKLSPEDAVRLAQNRRYLSAESVAKLLNASGIDTLSDLEKIITKALDAPRNPGSEARNPDAEERAGQLRYYAEELAKNKDIILLGIPVFWPDTDKAWAKLAFLGGELTAQEQEILETMADIADNVKMKTISGVLTGIFEVHNIHNR